MPLCTVQNQLTGTWISVPILKLIQFWLYIASFNVESILQLNFFESTACLIFMSLVIVLTLLYQKYMTVMKNSLV